MINKRINEIIQDVGSTIIVIKGIQASLMRPEYKYFSFNIENYDTLELADIKDQVVDEIIDNRKFSEKYKWMTIEEYQLFKMYSGISKMPVVLLQNNLYDKQFPYENTLSDIDNIYKNLYYQEDNELDHSQTQLLENVSLFYGQIDYSKLSEKYYVTYPEVESDIVIYNLYEEESIPVEITEDYPTKNVKQIELSENEIPFLDLENEILLNTNTQDIVFVLSGEIGSIPNRYLERLNILGSIRELTMFFTVLSMKRKLIENEEEYVRILREVYGFPGFKTISFYEYIEKHSKKTIEISQAQIIDDIVSQAEKAIHGESYRDIYVTASTGAGKSVMFQVPALYLAEKYAEDKPLTLVISPLIGLMNDQVANMRTKGVQSSATINGDTPPFEKEKILERIQNQEVNILYLSPETLQARTDIKMLVGDRKIGIVIIDEAHIVTTWGKSFRADYWYLGIYLSKLRKEYRFPIVTFTATAIYGGREDMYVDTRTSLNMINPISYFGKVRRNDIIMNIKSSEKVLDTEGRDYRKTKNTLALKHLRRADEKGEKTLMYFPTIRLLSEFYNFINQNAPGLAEKTGKYYGKLQKEEKDEVLSEFKNGEIQFVLATKAFGMGIDIPDITNVYHYAPTGNVVDYIQEIGRAARDHEKVPHGFAKIDFLKNDMTEVKQLYGMSAIRNTQIVEVMRKILSVYKEKGNNRNMIMSPEDFKNIFVRSSRDEESLDNKVKTVLLMIEKDFASQRNMGYSPFVARPRSLFGNDLIFVTSEFEKELSASELSSYFSKQYKINSKKYAAVYQVNLSGIWEKYYKRMSYPSFKFALFNAEKKEELRHKTLFSKFVYVSAVEVQLGEGISVEEVFSKYKMILEAFENFTNEYSVSEAQFTVVDLGNYFMRTLKIADKFEARAFAQTVINTAFEFSKIKNIKFITERSNSSADNQRYITHQYGNLFTDFIIETLTNSLCPADNYILQENKIISFKHRNQSEVIDSQIATLSIGEARNMLNYQLLGGNSPQIYIRMNSIYPLEKAIKQGNSYRNGILSDVQGKHYISVEMLKYLFTKKFPGLSGREKVVQYTRWFWENIEDYFMGIIPDEVKDALDRK